MIIRWYDRYYNIFVVLSRSQVKDQWITKEILITIQKSMKNQCLDPGELYAIFYRKSLYALHTYRMNFYRSSLMSNTTDSEVNSMSSEEVQFIQEDEPLPPKPGTLL